MKIGVLASGFGSNLAAILERCHGVDGMAVVAVGSDQPTAKAIERAAAQGIDTAVFERESYTDRIVRDAAMADWLAGRGADLVVLAGYMQLVSEQFLHRFPDRVINVHPALLPAFPGLHAVQQALDYGVKVFGVTVHFVDEGVDSGAIIAQRAIELPAARTADEVLERLRPLEHDLLTAAIADIAAGRVGREPGHRRRIVVDR